MPPPGQAPKGLGLYARLARHIGLINVAVKGCSDDMLPNDITA